jgi:hypothetical protein
MAAIIVAWFPTIPSVVVARGPIIIAIPTFVIPRRAVFEPTASATTTAAAMTILMIVVTRIAGIIRAWVIVTFA